MAAGQDRDSAGDRSGDHQPGAGCVECVHPVNENIKEQSMTRYFCDRCGQEAKEEMNLIVYEPHICDHTDGHRFVTKNEYCLCDECLMKMIGWIEKDKQL